MTSRKRLGGGAVLLIAIAATATGWRHAARNDRQPASTRVAAPPDAPAGFRERQSAGWVFGRLMGFPGAEHPLTSTVGPAGPPPAPPSPRTTGTVP